MTGPTMAAFDYPLPARAVAQQPAEPRDAARLLVDRGRGREPDDTHVRDLPTLLAPGDLLVVNTTRVLPGRIRLRRPTGGTAEVLLLEPGRDGWWRALLRPSRRTRVGERLVPDGGRDGDLPELEIEVGEVVDDGQREVRLHAVGDPLRALAAHGEVPLPPYIREPLADPERYQTVYADRQASAAAPTAGLHLTEELLARSAAAGIARAEVELVVGVDTFRPVTAERPADHRIHRESYAVPEATLEACRRTRAAGGRVVAVGTTTVRALESAARGPATGRTDLFIHGDFSFRLVDVLLTNFHLPRSSLLLLVDAFVGARWRDLYEVALERGYRFLSFGDAMLLTRSR